MSGISPASGSAGGSIAANVNALYATLPNTTQTTLASNLDLSPAQQAKIEQILQSAQSQGLSQTQTQSQINAVLTPAQQAKLQSDIADRRHHGRRASSTASDGTDEFGIPIGTSGSPASGTIAGLAAQFAIQSQLQDGDA